MTMKYLQSDMIQVARRENCGQSLCRKSLFLNLSYFTNIIKFYILTIIVSNVLFDRIVSAVGGQCPISKPGNPNGEATLFQV